MLKGVIHEDVTNWDGIGASYSVVLTDFGLQGHVAAWFYLRRDPGWGDGLRVSPVQIQGFINALKEFAEIVPIVAITEMDVRMGIPDGETSEYSSMDRHIGPSIWLSAGLATRQRCQGRVYQALLNAAFTVPELYGVSFWGFTDKYSWLNGGNPEKWPFTPKWADDPEEASNPCLLGDDPAEGEGEGEIEVYFRKPAFDSIRTAVENYFGPAFVVKDPQGADLVRFCRNGNVIILKAGIAGLHTNAAIPAGIGQQNSFIVENAQGVKKAVVTPEGEVYLAGQLFISQANLAPPASGTAFMVKDGDRVMVMIDEQGNLKLRGGLILRGIPYVLWQFMDGQGPPNSAPDDDYRPW